MKSKINQSMIKLKKVCAIVKKRTQPLLSKVPQKVYAIAGAALFIILLFINLLPTKNKTENAAEDMTTGREKHTSVSEITPAQEKGLDSDISVFGNSKANGNVTIQSTDNSSSWEITNEALTTIDKLVKKYFVTSKEFDEEVLNSKVTSGSKQKKREIVKKREGIEGYRDIKTYVKKGLDPQSYVVFSTYQMKFCNIDTLAPGMCVLYVVTEEDGQLFISDDATDDAKRNAYISSLQSEDDITAVIKKVDNGFKKALAKDKTLKSFVKELQKKAETKSTKATKSKTSETARTKTKTTNITASRGNDG